MNKQELKTICDISASKIANDPSVKEQLRQNLMKYSDDGKSISNAGLAAYCINESQKFTKELLYSVLCEVLDI